MDKHWRKEIFSRNITNNDLIVPKKPKLKCLSFTYNGAKLFNMLPLQMRENKYPNIFRFLYFCPLISLEKHFGWKSKIYYTILRGICLLVFWENSRTSKSPFEIIWPLMVTRLVYGTISIFRPYFATAYNVRYAICSVASILKWIEVQKILVIFNTIHSSSMYLLLVLT